MKTHRYIPQEEVEWVPLYLEIENLISYEAIANTN